MRITPTLGLAAVTSALALAGGCGDPAIEMNLELPVKDVADRYDVSCVGAIEVFVRGKDRGALATGANDPGRPADDLSQCVEVTAPGSFAALRAAIAGRFSLELPDSGLLGVDVRGSTGTCNKDVVAGDTIFYGVGEYRGGDSLAIRLAPNVSCTPSSNEVVRPVDLLELTETGTCPPPISDLDGGVVDAATIHPTVTARAQFDYANAFADLVGGTATLPLYRTVDAGSCLALGYQDKVQALYTATCARRGLGVCSSVGQIELPVIDGGFAFNSLDLTLAERHGGSVVGAVWGVDAGGTKVRLSGATVTPANTSAAAVVYADLPVNATRFTSLPNATSTNGTGLFIAYVGAPMEFVVQAPGYRDEFVRLGSASDISTALIVLTRR